MRKQQASRRCQVSGRHLPTVSYGQFQLKLPVLSDYTVFAHLDRLVSVNLVPGRLSSNSCSAASAALICVSCATRRIRFSVSDLFQKWPSWTGAADAGPFCLKKREKGRGTKVCNLHSQFWYLLSDNVFEFRKCFQNMENSMEICRVCCQILRNFHEFSENE